MSDRKETPEEYKKRHDGYANEMLERYKERLLGRDRDFKHTMLKYFEAVDEYTAKHGKAPPPVIFNVNGTALKTDDDDFPFKRSRGLDRDR